MTLASLHCPNFVLAAFNQGAVLIRENIGVNRDSAQKKYAIWL